MNDTLKYYRDKIDNIDKEIVRLFEERMAVSEQIGDYKRKNGLPVLDAAREDDKLTSIVSSSADTLKPYVRDLYKEIFSLSRDYQKNGIICRLAERDDISALRKITPKIV